MILALPLKAVGVLLLALVSVIVIEQAIHVLPLSHTPIQAAELRIQSERLILQHRTSHQALRTTVRNTIKYCLNKAADFTHAVESSTLFNKALKNQGLSQHLLGAVQQLEPAIEIYLLRLGALTHFLIPVGLFCAVGAVDGLVRRRVRKYCAGLESARIYHMAKRLVLPCLFWISFSYLVLPISMDPLIVYGLLSVTLPVLIGMVCSRFKKYF